MDTHERGNAMEVKITAQQVTDEYGRPALIHKEGIFVSDMRPVNVGSVQESVFDCAIELDHVQQTLAWLCATDRYSLIAKCLISKYKFPAHTLVKYGSFRQIRVILVGKREFRSRKYSVREKAREE